MEKIKLIPLCLLSLFVGKLLMSGTNLADSVIVLGLCGVVALEQYMDRHKKVQDIQVVVNAQNKALEKMALELDSMRTNVSSIRLSQGMKRAGS